MELYFWIVSLVFVIAVNVFLANYKHKLDLDFFVIDKEADKILEHNRKIKDDIEQYERYIANFRAK